jgi:hypothetical protein
MADAFRSTRFSLGNGQYEFTFVFDSGKKFEFTCGKHEWLNELNWRMGGGQGTSPKTLAAREAREEELRRRAIREDPELQYDIGFEHSRPAEYLARREGGPSGLSIAQRHRLEKMRASYPKP